MKRRISSLALCVALLARIASADERPEPPSTPWPAVNLAADASDDSAVEPASYEDSLLDDYDDQTFQPADDPSDYFTLADFDSRMRELTWSKGPFKIVPYGALWGSVLYVTERTFPGPYTLFVFSSDDEGEPAFAIDTRRTRLGLDIIGPRVAACGGAETGGKIEIDFHGAFIVENKPGVLLRHAYGEIKNEYFRLLAGQTWDVISPFNPGVLSYSVLWGQGNIGYRRAQVRVESYIPVPDDRQLTLQFSLNQNIVSDFNSEPGVEPEASGWPLVEGRIAYTDDSPGPFAGPVDFGVSGHIGEQGFDFTTVGPAPFFLPPQDDARLLTWSLNAELRVPVTKWTGVQGEFFMGQNLSTFLGGIVQGVCPCTREGIRSYGGWAEWWYDWSPYWHSHTGFGVDDPLDRDMVFGRSYNHVFFANMSHDVTDYLVVGLEVTAAKTKYRETRVGQPVPAPGEAVGIEFTGQYTF